MTKLSISVCKMETAHAHIVHRTCSVQRLSCVPLIQIYVLEMRTVFPLTRIRMACAVCFCHKTQFLTAPLKLFLLAKSAITLGKCAIPFPPGNKKKVMILLILARISLCF